MNKWNAVGFLCVNSLLIGFFAVATDSLGMKIFGGVFSFLNGLVAINGAIRS